MRSVVLCGSRRFKERILKIADVLEKAGVVVYPPLLETWEEDSWEELSPNVRRLAVMGLTLEHFQRIRWADVVWVCNYDGYAGCSTTLEIGVAAVLGKPIYALAEDSELARDILYTGYVPTVGEMLDILK